MSATQKRVWYACQAMGIAPNGSNTYVTVHGLQSVGVNTRFNLDHVFELGQAEVYETVDNIPDIEVTAEKCIDGYPLLWHLSTQGATAGTLIGRSNQKVMVGLSVYNDLNSNASGTPVNQAVMSGMFASNLQYQIQVNGPVHESVTLVGNSKLWTTSFTGPAFNGTDVPTASGGIQRRENVILGSGQSKFPIDIPGVQPSSGGDANYVVTDASGDGYKASFQSIRIQANLGRESLYELGHKGPYHRYVQFPVEVRTDIEIIAKSGDTVAANPEADNVTSQPIKVKLTSGTVFDMGTLNHLSSVTYGGGNAGQNGGNATMTFSYMNWNDLTITDPSDPSGL